MAIIWTQRDNSGFAILAAYIVVMIMEAAVTFNCRSSPLKDFALLFLVEGLAFPQGASLEGAPF